MGVFIQTMSMPKCCAECPLFVKIKSSSKYCRLLQADINPKTAKARKCIGCPLLEVNVNIGAF